MAATLEAIRTKVRRLTRNPSPDQLSSAEIDNYINTFILYDMPGHLKLQDYLTTFSFYTEPNIDTYKTDTTVLPVTNPLYDFKNKYITLNRPIYIAGYSSFYTQSREQFYSLYPLTASIQTIATGDGVTTNFTGTLSNVPVLANNVLFSSITILNEGLALHDDGTGLLTGDGTGTMDYLTGDYVLDFVLAPNSGQNICSQTVPYQASRPLAMLYYDDAFVVRPVPDQPYKITMDVYKQPTALVNDGDLPYVEQYWQYIAYGAAKKVFEDRMDLESVQAIMPEYHKQELLTLRRTITQMTSNRSATIYSEGTTVGNAGWWGSSYGMF